MVVFLGGRDGVSKGENLHVSTKNESTARRGCGVYKLYGDLSSLEGKGDFYLLCLSFPELVNVVNSCK